MYLRFSCQCIKSINLVDSSKAGGLVEPARTGGGYQLRGFTLQYLVFSGVSYCIQVGFKVTSCAYVIKSININKSKVKIPETSVVEIQRAATNRQQISKE